MIDYFVIAGVMIQFQENGTSFVFNLACRRVNEAHTALNIEKWLKEIIEEFKLDEKLLLVLAVDSAANIQKAARDYLKQLEVLFAVELELVESAKDANNDEIDLHSLVELEDSVADTEEHNRTLPADLTTSLAQDLVPTSYKIPCVAHQLQLAIGKFSELPVISRMLETTRRLSAKLRTSTVKNLLDKDKLPYGKMDQATRWSSKAAMTKRLEELQDFCVSNQTLCAGLRVKQEFWKTLNRFNKLIEPFSILTTQLQSEQLTIPEYNQFWVTAMLHPSVNSDWAPAKTLKELLNGRKEKIDENPIIKAGIYLDPRFRSISLSGIEQNAAKQVIRAICRENSKVNEPIPSPDDETDSGEEIEPLHAFLESHHLSMQSSQPHPRHQGLEEQFKIYEELNLDRKKLSRLNVTEFWKEQVQNPDAPLNKLATIALDIICAPVTEVTAERLFSHLNFVYSKHRSSLKGEIIEDILFCRWNQSHLKNA